ncbi:hypothetical protein DFH09DRAFT_1300373 [Mycena vulgaris]|nr:hypothetical protein DFH09DRAFT_1300373 [Mycena vulgaris]
MSAIGPAPPPHLLARPDSSEAGDESPAPHQPAAPSPAANDSNSEDDYAPGAGGPPPGHARSLLLLLRAAHIVCPRHCVPSPLAPTRLKARTFARSAAPSRSTDNTLWTETPAERRQRIAHEVSSKKYRGRGLRKEALRGVEEHTRKTRG